MTNDSIVVSQAVIDSTIQMEMELVTMKMIEQLIRDWAIVMLTGLVLIMLASQELLRALLALVFIGSN